MRRLPHRDSNWVLSIDDPRKRILATVDVCSFTGDGWLVTMTTLPEAPVPRLGPLTVPRELYLSLDRFWESVTPVNGRIEDLSNEISEEQYGKRSSAVAEEDHHV